MANPTQWQQTFRQPGALQSSSPGSPGLSGAISDAVGAAGKTLFPTKVVARPKLINAAADAAAGQTPTKLGDEF